MQEALESNATGDGTESRSAATPSHALRRLLSVETRSTRRTRARIAAALYAAAALLGLISFVLVPGPQFAGWQRLAIAGLAVATIAGASLVLLLADHIGLFTMHVTSIVSTLVVGVVQVIAVDEPTVVGAGLLYIWVAVFVGLFYRPWGIVGQLAWIAVVQLVAMRLVDTPAIVSHLTLAMGTCAAAAFAVAVPMRFLRNRAATDTLSGFFNRSHALALVAGELRQLRKPGESVTLIVVSLSGMKAINKLYGQKAGDRVLRTASQRVHAVAGHSGLLARFSGDEFLLWSSLLDTTAARELAARLHDAIQQPMEAAPAEARLSASIGIASTNAAGTSADRLVADAGVAVQRARQAGRGHTVIFDDALRAVLAAEAQLDMEIARGLRQGEFRLHYQPLIDLKTRETVGVEALIRWQHPQRGLLAPDTFIPRAEQSDLICDLGAWVLAQAARQLAAWQQAGETRLHMAVNISGRHVLSGRLVDDIRAATEQAGIDGRHLVVEITETVLVHASHIGTVLAELRDLGVAVSIDDFGTGYTSIAGLGSIPADIVKIDRSFVTHPNPAKRGLVRLIAHAAHIAGARVVAEGIETAEVAAALRVDGIEYGQGYFFARPQPPEALPMGGMAPPRVGVAA